MKLMNEVVSKNIRSEVKVGSLGRNDQSCSSFLLKLGLNEHFFSFVDPVNIF